MVCWPLVESDSQNYNFSDSFHFVALRLVGGSTCPRYSLLCFGLLTTFLNQLETTYF